MSKYPLWKYIILILVIAFGLLYSAPILFGDDPAVQVSTTSSKIAINQTVIDDIEKTLQDHDLSYQSLKQEDNGDLLIRFKDVDSQLKAKDFISATLDDDYTVALNLAAKTPKWLTSIGAEPMKLGLDLRGGVHFLLSIDVNSLLEKRLEGDKQNITDELRDKKIRYSKIDVSKNNAIVVRFRNNDDLTEAAKLINKRFPELEVTKTNKDGVYRLEATISPAALVQAQNYAVEQSMTILRNRINELGVAEPIVQRQGADRIAVDLPGVQDTARAKQIVGGTATLEFHLADTEHDVRSAVAGVVPIGSQLYEYDGRPVLLQKKIILSGTSITGASSSISEDGQPSVSIRLGGGGESLFYRTTRDNVGKPLAILYVETKMDQSIKDGEVKFTPRKVERVISIATIKSALGNNFQITGLSDPDEARNLALLLRAGALPAPITFIEESTVGPSLGKENIEKGVISVAIGFALIVVFMLVYYRFFGLLADLALTFNLVLLVAILSVIGATLTLPGIAAILLTLGMAVDANVLIFERIREELRNGMSPLASIQAGYERAFSTIVDANVTTLIAAVAMFAIGTGAIKGFAITLTIGLLTSMISAITGTRAIVYLVYGRRNVKKLSIGI